MGLEILACRTPPVSNRSTRFNEHHEFRSCCHAKQHNFSSFIFDKINCENNYLPKYLLF